MYRTILWKQSLPVLVTFGPQQLCLPSENVTEDRDEKYNQTNFIANVKAELMKNEYVFAATQSIGLYLLCLRGVLRVNSLIKSGVELVDQSNLCVHTHRKSSFPNLYMTTTNDCNLIAIFFFPFSSGLSWLFQSYLLQSIRSAVECTLLLKVGVGVTVEAVAFLWNMICLHLNFRLRDPRQIARYTMAMYSSLDRLI